MGVPYMADKTILLLVLAPLLQYFLWDKAANELTISYAHGHPQHQKYHKYPVSSLRLSRPMQRGSLMYKNIFFIYSGELNDIDKK